MLRIVTYKLTKIAATPAINAYIEAKFGHLDKFLGDMRTPRDCVIEIGKTTKHHKKGDVFRAEADLVLPHKIIRAEAETPDLYTSIDLLETELQRQIRVFKGKAKTIMLKGARKVRGK